MNEQKVLEKAEKCYVAYQEWASAVRGSDCEKLQKTTVEFLTAKNELWEAVTEEREEKANTEEEKVKYVHHTLEQAVFDLVCLAYPHVKMKDLVNNLKKDCDAEIEKRNKERKALEIIKRDPHTVVEAMDDNDTWEGLLNEFDMRLPADFPVHSKEEFDLLKEVMK